MRSELAEGLIFGAGIGLAVITIRAIVGNGLPWAQALALVLVALVLCAIQLRLTLRRRRRQRPPREPTEPHRPVERRRAVRRSPFDYELTRNWTGLKEPGPKDGPAQAPDDRGSEATEERADAARRPGDNARSGRSPDGYGIIRSNKRELERGDD
jgi:hypothetical protein